MGLINSVVVTTNGREVPDTLILPIESFNVLAYTRMTDGNDKTILTYIRENFPTINMIDWVTELTTAGSGSTKRMMIYTRDMNNVTLEIPQQFEQFPAQQKGMEFVVPCHARCGGVIVYYPLSVAYGDDI